MLRKQAVPRKTPRRRETRSRGNARASRRQRKLRAESQTATYEEGRPARIDSLHLKFILGLLLLPVCYVTTETFFATIAAASTRTEFWLSPEFLFFVAGGVAWLVYFIGFPRHRPVALYVWGHETSHVIAATFYGANISGFRASRHGGHIYTDKTNFIISLAPYLFPIFTVIVGAVAVVASLFFDILAYHERALFGIAGCKPVWILLALVGLTWSFHLTFTVWMISRHQPDLEDNGNFFSLILIYFCNLVIICLFVIGFSKQATVVGFATDWWTNFGDFFRFVGEALEAGARMAKRLIAGASG